MLWSGNKCGKTPGNETSRQPLPLQFMRSKVTGECEIFQLFGKHVNKLCQMYM
jgi:hypothetical protein